MRRTDTQHFGDSEFNLFWQKNSKDSYSFFFLSLIMFLRIDNLLLFYQSIKIISLQINEL